MCDVIPSRLSVKDNAGGPEIASLALEAFTDLYVEVVKRNKKAEPF